MGRAAVITGASRGIGRAIARRLHHAGARVAICGRDRPALESLAAELGAGAVVRAFDVTKRASVDAEVASLAGELGGQLDVVVNNAGVSPLTPLDATDDGLWDATLATNLTAPMYVLRAALPFLRPGASVINISSVLGRFGVAAKGAYCAAKHGVIGWTRAVALELAGRGVRVNAVCPGWVETEMAATTIAETAAVEGIPADEWRRRAEDAVPQRRFLDPTEVAELVAFLASPAAQGITAEVLTLSAGATPF